jgi:hypothetical protein
VVLFSIFAGVVGEVRLTAVMNAAYQADARHIGKRKDVIVKLKGGDIPIG